MRYFKTYKIGFLFLWLVAVHVSNAQEESFIAIPFTNMQAFDNPGENWILTSNFISDFSKPWDIKKLDMGSSVIVNNVSKKHRSHLVTKKEFGDVYIELDFMMDKGSNSGVYLQGRYEVQLFDSWLKGQPTFADCGGLYQRWDTSREIKGYEGMAPLENAARAPGLWQQLRVKFRAPRFDSNGKKISNARFEEVYLNNVLVQQQVEVSGPTRSAMFKDEKAIGPLVIQGDHGKVAFRNIRYSLASKIKSSGKKIESGIIMVKPDKKPYVLRSFLNYGDKKLNYVISIGTQQGLNYSYDFDQGAWLQVWRGGFMDVTDMWHKRGISQLAVPLGGVVSFSEGPSVAHLSSTEAEWPESIAFEDIQDKSYLLDATGMPTFKYTQKGVKISDKINSQDNGKAFQRILQIENPTSNLFCRVASAGKIERVSKDLYRVDGIYYVRLDLHSNPIIRKTLQGQEMLVEIGKMKTPFTYSIIW